MLASSSAWPHLPSWCAQDEETASLLVRLGRLVQGVMLMQLQAQRTRATAATYSSSLQGRTSSIEGGREGLPHNSRLLSSYYPPSSGPAAAPASDSSPAAAGGEPPSDTSPLSLLLGVFWDLFQSRLASKLHVMSCEAFSPAAMTALLGLATGTIYIQGGGGGGIYVLRGSSYSEGR